MRDRPPLLAPPLRLPLTEPPDPRLTVRARRDAGGATELGLVGELDVRTVRLLCDAAVAHLRSGRRQLRLDLSGITWCDNASLYTLLGVRGAVHAAQGSLELTVTSETVERALVRTGVGPRLVPYPGTSPCSRMTEHQATGHHASGHSTSGHHASGNHSSGNQRPFPAGPPPHRAFWRGSCGDLLCREPTEPGEDDPSVS
ncbi:STAS domain-containing protein [Streptomyces sp. NPDC018045]|uniref:STAS domain-containing protein n=1 Tax=Streptomyces sp. NPDC018045 TaxID=3365037 RepID=UPI003790FAD2